MQAIVIPRHGPPNVFEERELPERRLKPQDVRIEVHAAGVNFADLMGRVGLYPDAPPMPYAPGYEVAGVVLEAGERAVERLPPGTRVMAITRFGGYAHEVQVPMHGVVPLSDEIDFAHGAAAPVVYLTGYLALVHSGNAREGERVLVHGAGGGVGLAVLDLSRDLGVEMYGTAGGEAKCRRLEGMGYTRVFDHRTEDLETASRQALRGGAYDLILDPLGPASFQRSLGMLAPLGRVVCYGFSELVTGTRRKLWHAATKLLTASKVNPITLMNKNNGVFGLNLAHLFTERELQERALGGLAERITKGELNPHVDRTFPLTAAGAADAHAYIHARKSFGKVVLTREV